MIKIIPAILPQSYRAIEGGVEKVKDAVDTVQIDFVDGYFAPNKTWWFNGKDREQLDTILSEEQGLPLWDSMNYEFDLMIKNPFEHIDTFIALGPSKIVFHVESLEKEKTLQYFEQLPEIVRTTIKFGIAIGLDTDPDTIEPYLPYIESIQCMGIAQVGFQGNAFDARAIDMVKTLHALYPDKTIVVDGAVNDQNASHLVQAGARELVVGSFIFQNIDPRGTIDALQRVCIEAATASENSN